MSQPLMGNLVEIIKQYPAEEQVKLSVCVQVPGRFFPGLQPGERKENYLATAVGSHEAMSFAARPGFWPKQKCPAIKCIFAGDAAESETPPEFWLPLSLWNRYRHDTYKGDRDAELRFLPEDQLGQLAPQPMETPAADPMGDIFTLVGTQDWTQKHKDGSTTATKKFTYRCKDARCNQWSCGEIGKSNSLRFRHLRKTPHHQQEYVRIAVNAKHSKVQDDGNGGTYSLYSFEECLPHHIRYVIWCFMA